MTERRRSSRARFQCRGSYRAVKRESVDCPPALSRARPACERRAGPRGLGDASRSGSSRGSLSLSSSHSHTALKRRRDPAITRELLQVIACIAWSHLQSPPTPGDDSPARAVELVAFLSNLPRPTRLQDVALCWSASHQRQSRLLRRHRARIPFPSTHSQPSHFTTYSPPRNNQLPTGSPPRRSLG